MSLSKVVAALVLCAPAPGGQQYQFTTVAHAQPDECFGGAVGQPYVPYDGGCPGGSVEKRNQTYPWSMTRFEDKLYIGTGGNVSCFGAAALGGGALGFVPGLLVCEGAQSQFPLVPPPLLPVMGDWRPPQMWRYDESTGTQTEITPPDPKLLFTMGIRAAGNADGVLLMGGPTYLGVGIVLYAWDIYSGQYLGSWATRDYSNVRKMVNVNDELYIGVQNTAGGSGAILRWTGSHFAPFFFETVGLIDNDAAYIVEHQGQLVVGTWPPTGLGSTLGLGYVDDFPPAGVWVSPPVPPGGLRWYHQFFWRKVFSADDYEPDPVIATSYLIGEPVSLGDYVMFGTMNVTGQLAIILEYGPTANTPETMRKAHRALAYFRVTGLGPLETPDVDLLYGARRLNRYDPVHGWQLVDNAMGGIAPMHGPAGFGNPYNSYLWSSAVAFGKAFVGTLDTGFTSGSPTPGADLYSFSDPDQPAQLVHDNGLTSPLNLGLRNMIGAPDILYVGAMNLWNLSPIGGWQLIEVLED